MSNEKLKSVLVFYSIKDNTVFDMNIEDIWANYVIAKVDNVSCKNVFEFNYAPEELLSLVKSKNLNAKLLADIKSEFESGANVMFVKPVVGNPLDGFFIKDFL